MNCKKCSGCMIHEEEHRASRYRCYNCGNRVELKQEEMPDIFAELDREKAHKLYGVSASDHARFLKVKYWKKNKRTEDK